MGLSGKSSMMVLLEVGILAFGSVHLYVLFVNFRDSTSHALSLSLLLWTGADLLS